MLDSNSMYVKDEQGNDKRMIILFTFDSDDYGKQYVVFQDPENVEEIFASAFNEQGELLPIESDEEWDMVEEVIATFTDDEESTEE
jgi:uncharacterized protein YrzB (UPF0473 family)